MKEWIQFRQRDPILRPETKLPSGLLKTLNAALVSSNIGSLCAEFEFRSWFLVSTVATSSSANCSWKVCPKGISRRQNLARHCRAKMMYGWLLVWMRVMYCTCFSLSDSHSICAERGVTLWTCCVGAYTESLVKELRKSNHPISWVSTTSHPGLHTAKPGHGKGQAGCRGIAILPHLGPGRSVGWTMAIGDPLWNLQGSHDCHSPCRGLRLGWWTRGIGWQSLLH